MRSLLIAIVALQSVLSGSVCLAFDYGFPTLNSVGRYLGAGWSHHTYHSHVDGRFNIVSNLHPACAYPSQALTSIYSPHYVNYPPSAQSAQNVQHVWQPPTVTQPLVDNVRDNRSKQPESIMAEVDEDSELVDLESEDDKSSSPKSRPPGVKADSDKDVLAKPASPPKPTTPAPPWIKPYLEPDPKSEANEQEDPGEIIEIEPSPSDSSSATRKKASASSRNRYTPFPIR